MKFNVVVEYEYPTEHKLPVKAEIVLHGDRVITDNIKWVEQESRWIPVSERLPEKNKAVLTYVDTGASKTYCLAYWKGEGWEEWIGYRMVETEMGYKVLAWQPLPEPYKEDKDGKA